MANSPKTFPRRGSVYLVNLDPTFGKEIKKTRPAVVIQNDIGNKNSPLTIVAPITSAEKYPHPVYVNIAASEGGLAKNSIVLLDQIRAIDQRRLSKYLGQMTDETMKKIDRALMISLDLQKYLKP